jgi:hypothetical protein
VGPGLPQFGTGILSHSLLIALNPAKLPRVIVVGKTVVMAAHLSRALFASGRKTRKHPTGGLDRLPLDPSEQRELSPMAFPASRAGHRMPHGQLLEAGAFGPSCRNRGGRCHGCAQHIATTRRRGGAHRPGCQALIGSEEFRGLPSYPSRKTRPPRKSIQICDSNRL